MRSIGSILVLVGAVSAFLKLFVPGMYHALLIWVDNWGSTTGWFIRVGVILLGIGLMWLDRVLAKRRAARAATQSSQP